MSEQNKNIEEFDLMMKSILDEAQEVVPESVWEGVSAGLDKAARRSTVVLWWKRAAIGTAAAAAVVLGVFFTYSNGSKLVPDAENNDMIAVVEPVKENVVDETATDEADISGMTMLAHADDAKPVFPHKKERMEKVIPDITEEAAESAEDEAITKEEVKEASGYTEKNQKTTEPLEYFPEDWGEEEITKVKRGVSFSISGVTGTNDALSQNRVGLMMRPSVTPAPKKSGIKETSTKSSYGIPLSFGAGVKIDLSRRWSIGTGLNYTFLSRQFYGKYTKVSPEGDIESVTSSDISNRQHYIGIPVNAYYDIVNNDKINFYAYAGGMVEKCLSDSYHLLNTDIRHKEKATGVQLSADAGIGVEFMLGKHLGIYIDPSVRYYFRNENQPKSIRTVQPLMLGFEMGLRARL